MFNFECKFYDNHYLTEHSFSAFNLSPLFVLLSMFYDFWFFPHFPLICCVKLHAYPPLNPLDDWQSLPFLLQPETDGYIAIVLPKLKEFNQVMATLQTKASYSNTPQAVSTPQVANPAHDASTPQANATWPI